MAGFIPSAARPIGRRGKSFPKLLGMLFVRWMQWQRRRRDQAALLRQPDYLLRDIGVARHEIERAIRGRRGQ